MIPAVQTPGLRVCRESPALQASALSCLRIHSRELWLYLGCAAAVLVFYSPFFFARSSLVLLDYLNQNVPNRVFAAEALRDGRLPHWTHLLFGGFPFLADPQTAVFYPLHLLLSYVTPYIGCSAVMDNIVVGHVLFLSLGLAFFARSFEMSRIGALGVSLIGTFNGYMVMQLCHTVIFESIVNGVWAMACLVRAVRSQRPAWAVAAGLLISSSILAGHWQTALYVLYAAFIGSVLFVVSRSQTQSDRHYIPKALLLIALAIALGLCASMVQILPSLHLLQFTNRRELPISQVLRPSWPLAEALGLWFPALYRPFFWRMPEDTRWGLEFPATWAGEDCSEYLYHLGIMAFGIGLLGFFANLRRPLAWVLSGCAFLTWVAAFGKYLGLYLLLYAVLPGFKQVRIPPRLMFVGFISWSLLVGLGLDALLCQAGRSREAVRQAASLVIRVIASLFVVLTVLLVASMLSSGSLLGALRDLFIFDPNFRLGVHRSEKMFFGDMLWQLAIGVSFGLFACGWLYLAAIKCRNTSLVRTLGCLALFGELALYGMQQNIQTGNLGFDIPVTENYLAFPVPPQGRTLGNWGINNDAKNGALVVGIPCASGYNPIKLNWYAGLRPSELMIRKDCDERILDMWDISHLMYFRTSTPARVGGKNAELVNTGVVELHAHPNPSKAARWALPVPPGTRKIHLVTAAKQAEHIPDGTTVARLQLCCETTHAQSVWPLRLGRELGPWDSQTGSDGNLENATSFRTSPMELIPSRVLRQCGWSDTRLCPQGTLYASTFDLSQCDGGSLITVAVASPAPFALWVSHVGFESTTGPLEIHTALEGLGHRYVHSSQPGVVLVERTTALGPAWIAPKASLVDYASHPDAARQAILKEGYDPTEEVILDRTELSGFAPDVLAAAPRDPNARTVFRRQSPEQITVESSCTHPGWLVISQTYYSGWKAKIDGAPARLFRANGCHTAVRIEAGTHVVQLEYATPRLMTGLVVSVATWCLALLYLAWQGQRLLASRRGHLLS